MIGPAPQHEGYLRVRLDTPAIYDNGIVQEDLSEIIEAPDNLQLIGATEAATTTSPGIARTRD